MRKPIYLLPFIFVYKIVFAILKIPYYIIRYFTIGTLYTINKILVLFEYSIKGFIWVCYFVYQLFRYFIKGISVFICTPIWYIQINKKPKIKLENKKEENTLEITSDDKMEETIPEIKTEHVIENKDDSVEQTEELFEQYNEQPIITEKILKKLEKQKL